MCEALTFVKKDISTVLIHIHTQAYISYLQNTRHIKKFFESIKSFPYSIKSIAQNQRKHFAILSLSLYFSLN